MRTLYVRIIVVTMVIMLVSSIIAFMATNVYYDQMLKPENDQKITAIAEDIVRVYEKDPSRDLKTYLNNMAGLGYLFYIAGENGERQHFGIPFDDTNLSEKSIQRVLDGETYHGIKNYPWGLFITGFFSNELKNTVGVPLKVDGETKALFVRANTEQQFGEMRFFLAVLLVLLLLISFLLILLSTRYIVKPVSMLTEATKRIAGGNYHVQLPVRRKDEIGDLAKHFKQMTSSIEEMEEKRQEFVSNVSHEIQSPLTSIKGFSKTLRTEELSKDEEQHYLEIIEKEAGRLSVLGKQLLTLSMLDSDERGIQLLPYSLSDQLKDIVTTTRWQWQEKELAIDMEVPPNLIMVGDEKSLYQVWLNLVTNAIHYTNPGGMISIHAEGNKREIHVFIKDTGIGIKHEDIPHLFERFYKADKSRDRSKNSTGLGLSIVRKIIDMHAGTVMVESEPGIGTVFHITLPIDKNK